LSIHCICHSHSRPLFSCIGHWPIRLVQGCLASGRPSDVDVDVLDWTHPRWTSDGWSDVRDPAVGTSGRHGGRPLQPLVGYYVRWSGCERPLCPTVRVAVDQPSARLTAMPSARHKTIAKTLKNQAVRRADWPSVGGRPTRMFAQTRPDDVFWT
jgi:hypothetical protein